MARHSNRLNSTPSAPQPTLVLGFSLDSLFFLNSGDLQQSEELDPDMELLNAKITELQVDQQTGGHVQIPTYPNGEYSQGRGEGQTGAYRNRPDDESDQSPDGDWDEAYEQTSNESEKSPDGDWDEADKWPSDVGSDQSPDGDWDKACEQPSGEKSNQFPYSYLDKAYGWSSEEEGKGAMAWPLGRSIISLSHNSTQAQAEPE